MKGIPGTEQIGKFARICRWFVLAVILIVIAWGYTIPIDTRSGWFKPYTTINTGWTQVVDGESNFIATAQDAIPGAVGDTVVLERTVSLKEEERYVMFYLEHQEVQAYIDDVEIYRLVCPEELEFFGSMGKRWVSIQVPKEANGKTLRLEITSNFLQYNSMPKDIYWLKFGDLQIVQAQNMWLCNTSTLALFCLSVLFYVNGGMWSTRRLKRYLIGLGDLYLMIALWLCADINVIAVLLKRVSISSMLAMIFVRMVPVAFYHLCTFAEKERTWWMSVAGILAWGNLLVAIILQFVFGVSLVSQLWGYAIAMFLVTILCLVGMIHQFITKPYTRHLRRIYYSSSVLLIAALCETLFCIFGDVWGSYTGVAVTIGSILYAILVHILLVRNESISDVQKRELQDHYKALQKKPLTSQINAHFLGNALNSISAYCKEDPEKADHAVQLLGKYMREYMHLVDKGDDVPVEDELHLVQLYYEIQKTRFGDAIQFEVINEFDDFELPPLSLQPLAENALWHGIRSSIEEGAIKIKTMKSNNMGVVIISDNGVGFETDIAETYMGVSLTNIKSRIMVMGGTMDIYSRVGRGTEVVLRVPLETMTEFNEGDLI